MKMEREDVGIGSFIMMDTMPMKKILKIMFAGVNYENLLPYSRNGKLGTKLVKRH